MTDLQARRVESIETFWHGSSGRASDDLRWLIAEVRRLQQQLNAKGMSCTPDLDMMRLIQQRDAAIAETSNMRAKLTEVQRLNIEIEDRHQNALALLNKRERERDAALAERDRTVRVLELERLARQQREDELKAEIGRYQVRLYGMEP